ncbi:protein translocase subunit SecF [Candidatus Microgenomates bacterium]|nr:protein translocase subunit SecF [Candidatus Microgenomates bacterium]
MRIIEHWKIWFFISALAIVPGIIALSLWGLKPGIDFAGGTLLEMNFPNIKELDAREVADVFANQGIEGAQITLTASNTFLARSHSIGNAQYKELATALNQEVGEAKELRLETVGPTISRDLTKKAVWAIILAILAIIFYIAWAFRTVPSGYSSWKFGLSTIVALLHDVVIVMGAFAILGHYKGVEVDSLFVTAILTTLGFSVHDTIVVFDRIRENLRTTTGTFTQVANKSIGETMSRSINTSATVIFTLLALLLFGGASIYYFVLALVIGIIAGTYSSIFNASIILVLWHKKKV